MSDLHVQCAELIELQFEWARAFTRNFLESDPDPEAVTGFYDIMMELFERPPGDGAQSLFIMDCGPVFQEAQPHLWSVPAHAAEIRTSIHELVDTPAEQALAADFVFRAVAVAIASSFYRAAKAADGSVEYYVERLH